VKKLFFIIFLSILFHPVIHLPADEPEELYLVSEGDRFHGESVLRLQKFLVYEGFTIGPDGVDGWFGQDTDKALRQYQEVNKLPVTGKIAVSDIPAELSWVTSLKPIEANSFPPLWEQDLRVLKETGRYRTWYGTFTLPFSHDPDLQYELVELSPNQRFYCTLVYSPMMEQQMGQPLYVYDILTEKSRMISALDMYAHRMEEEDYIELYNRTENSEYAKVRWTRGSNLAIWVTVYVKKAPALKSLVLLEINTYAE
jgi:hypothetical protein